MPYICVLEGKKFSLFVTLGIYNEKCGFSKISEGEYRPRVVGNRNSAAGDTGSKTSYF